MVKITKESGSTVVEGLEHSLVSTWGVRASTTITKGYVCAQDGNANATLAVGGSVGYGGDTASQSIGTIIGIADETVTGSSTHGDELIRIITHGWAWVCAGAGAVGLGVPVKVSNTVPGLVCAAIWSSAVAGDAGTWVVGTTMVSTSTGSESVLLNLRI